MNIFKWSFPIYYSMYSYIINIAALLLQNNPNRADQYFCSRIPHAPFSLTKIVCLPFYGTISIFIATLNRINLKKTSKASAFYERQITTMNYGLPEWKIKWNLHHCRRTVFFGRLRSMLHHWEQRWKLIAAEIIFRTNERTHTWM